MSRKPFTPSRLLLPTEMKVLGTPVATPTVYWISRFCNGNVRFSPSDSIHHPYSLNTGLAAGLVVLPTIERLQAEGSRRGNIWTETGQKRLL